MMYKMINKLIKFRLKKIIYYKYKISFFKKAYKKFQDLSHSVQLFKIYHKNIKITFKFKTYYQIDNLIYQSYNIIINNSLLNNLYKKPKKSFKKIQIVALQIDTIINLYKKVIIYQLMNKHILMPQILKNKNLLKMKIIQKIIFKHQLLIII